MPALKTLSVFLQGLFYIGTGQAHFTKTAFFLKIMPPYLPYPLELVYLSGVAEILLGLGLWIPATRPYAAWGIIALLFAVLPANVYMLTSGGAGMDFPTWALWLRLPFQGVLMALAYWHTR